VIFGAKTTLYVKEISIEEIPLFDTKDRRTRRPFLSERSKPSKRESERERELMWLMAR
jgi:hypothetical protein